jgi:hypothetical protein
MALIERVKPVAIKQICFMAALALVTLPVFDGEAMAKGKQSTKTKRASRSYFVPPPPAYSPSMLPELQRQSQAGAATEETSDKLVEASDTSDKYVKAKDGYQDPKAVHTNKYVTYWNQK